MAQANKRAAWPEQKGMRPSLEFRPLHQLQSDPSYQRAIDSGQSQALIRRIAASWDWDLCQPLAVARRADGTLWVVDGQHRLAAARLRNDIYDLPCVVTVSAGIAAEAASFVAMNRTRKPLSALELFRGAVASRDASAAALMGVLEHVGFSLPPHLNPVAWKPRQMANISALQAALREHGEARLARCLRIIAAAFDKEVLHYAATIFPGVMQMIGLDLGKALDDGLLTCVLQGQSQAEWREDILTYAATQSVRWQVASFSVIQNAYREAAEEE